MIKGHCHCGKVEITLPNRPEYINLCDCSLCSKSGGAWGYFEVEEITVKGSTKGYRRADYSKPAVEMQFCPNCGTTTHWITTENLNSNRAGVNMRIFEPGDLAGIEARTLDGRNWQGSTAASHRRAPGKLGEDVFL